MRYLALVVGGLLFWSAAAFGHGSPDSAGAELRNAKGESVGTAVLIQRDEGVMVVLKVHGLPPGLHGFHIHAVGKCDPPAYTTAGGHFNPHGKKHGLKNPDGLHAGDLPNLLVGPDGKATIEVVAPHVTLGEGKHALFQPGGTALVIHADPDDEKTDPTGNSGSRIACGVITKEGKSHSH